MEFFVEKKRFVLHIDLSDTLKIKSHNKDYDVIYSNKNLDMLVNEIYSENDFIFIDRNVYNLSPETFKDIDNLKKIYIFDAIEDNKNIESVLELIDILLCNNFTKKNKLIVIGGGITQEVGGFAAAIYKRGIQWILIPTTILSMTDSCIGSKVSINRGSKNMLGLFIAPNKIYISDYFLNSLKKDDIMSGIGEGLKLSLIGGSTTYALFKENYISHNYMNIIKISSLVKKEIIEYDEFEKHERKVLNYGHTIGHALESVSKYFIPHGIAILIGMYIKNILFYKNKYDDINIQIVELIDKKFLEIDFNYTTFIKHVMLDKKNDGNKICFILLNEIGHTIIVYKNIEDIEYELKNILKHMFINYSE
jgi:3-dehydroquinate synthase